jgi:BirA family biotin operon repressor/biotin-[acetyl-CoA-carboxylase] ligase
VDHAASAVAGVPLLCFAEVGSTNSEAMQRGLGGTAAPFWVIAEHQTKGRGRSGRGWSSLPGNLYASLGLRLSCPVATAAELSLVAGVAAIDAIRVLAPAVSEQVRLKWPNDLLIGGAKVGGILVESSQSKTGLVAVIGFGINLAAAPEVEGRATTCLALHGADVQPAVFLDVLAAHMQERLRLWDEGRGFDRLRADWIKRAGPVGEPLAVHAGRERWSGRFAGLDGDGAMLLALQDGDTMRVTFGDVMLLDNGQPAHGAGEHRKGKS